MREGYMRNGMSTRLLGLLLAALLLVCGCVPALADDYDPDQPEILEAGHLSATAAILIEASSGNVIFAKNSEERMYPASTTKILTVWLAITMADQFEGGLEHKFTVSENAVNLAPDESSAKLAAGENLTIQDLCYAAMLVSGNDAATALAEGIAGSVEAFAVLMNEAAYSLGCTGTHFVNANGLHDDNHYTTAHDLAIIARVAMQNETFKAIVLRSEYTMAPDTRNRKRVIYNGNNFVARTEGKETRYYEYATGVKTGTTSAAGNCLVASASKNGISLISVALGCPSDASRYSDSRKLMEYGFSQYKSTSIAEIYALNPRVIDIRGFDLDDPGVGQLELSLRMVSTNATDRVVTTQQRIDYWVQNFSALTVTEFTRDFYAPVTQGEVMGTLTYYPETGNPVVYELIATRSIAAREQLAPTVDDIIAAAENDPNPFPRITAELVILYLVLPALGIFLLVRLLIALIRFIKKRVKVRAYKPTSRYYR